MSKSSKGTGTIQKIKKEPHKQINKYIHIYHQNTCQSTKKAPVGKP